MNTAGITRRIFDFCLAFIGHLRAGLAYVNVLASMIFAGITGSSVADVAGLGAVEIKAMKEEGYDPGYSAAITAASSCIGPIVPPSIIMIVIGVMSEVSIGRLFAAGFLPGILMGLSLMVLIYYHSHVQHKNFPKGRARMGFRERMRATWRGLPAVLSPVIILGGIITGIVTPTEAGVIAVVYSTILGFLYRELHLRDLFGVFKDAVLATGVVMLVIAGAQMLGWIVTIERIAHAIYNFIQTTALSTWMILALINLGIIFLGCFIEGVAVIMIVVPVLLPAVKALGLSPVQFGAFLAVNIMIGLLTPPVGMSVYIASDIAGIPVMEGFRKTLVFALPILAVLILTTYWPAVSLFLPNLIFGR
jgi:tripartite ATP-independent transporter DctM subunit